MSRKRGFRDLNNFQPHIRRRSRFERDRRIVFQPLRDREYYRDPDAPHYLRIPRATALPGKHLVTHPAKSVASHARGE